MIFTRTITFDRQGDQSSSRINESKGVILRQPLFAYIRSQTAILENESPHVSMRAFIKSVLNTSREAPD
jgi:hypothetical protein